MGAVSPRRAYASSNRPTSSSFLRRTTSGGCWDARFSAAIAAASRGVRWGGADPPRTWPDVDDDDDDDDVRVPYEESWPYEGEDASAPMQTLPMPIEDGRPEARCGGGTSTCFRKARNPRQNDRTLYGARRSARDSSRAQTAKLSSFCARQNFQSLTCCSSLRATACDACLIGEIVVKLDAIIMVKLKEDTPLKMTGGAVGPPTTSSAALSQQHDARAQGETVPLASRRKSKWLKCAEISLVLTYVLVVALAGVVIWQLVERSSERHVIAWCVGAMAVGIAVPLSLHDMHAHLLHFVRPELQRAYVRIIAMVPIYAVESWLALRFKDSAVYLETMREAYEAYTIYSFFRLMVDHVGAGWQTNLARRRTAGVVPLMKPFCCFRPWTVGAFRGTTSRLVFQYVFLRTFLAIAALICEKYDVYGEGEFDPSKLYLYSVLILNASQVVAMYGLVSWYHEFAGDMDEIKPLRKLLAVKAIVFVSFWQSVVISALVHFHVIEGTLTYTEDEVAKGLQDFLICLEMAVAAIVHRHVFSWKDFENAEGEAVSMTSAIAVLMPSDVVKEAAEHANLKGIALPTLPTPKWPPRLALKHGAAADASPSVPGSAPAGAGDDVGAATGATGTALSSPATPATAPADVEGATSEGAAARDWR
jgi:hypothetical protein